MKFVAIYDIILAMSGAESERWLFFNQGLPDWLAMVPMDALKPTLIPVGESKTIPLGLIVSALESNIGTIIGSLSILPELVEHFVEFTENPAWRNLPTEPTSITRIAKDLWEIHVGDYSVSFSGDELHQRIKEVLNQKEEQTS